MLRPSDAQKTCPKPDTGMCALYLLYSVLYDRYKIGITTNIEQRMKKLRRHNSLSPNGDSTLGVYYIFWFNNAEVAHKIERALHQVFSHCSNNPQISKGFGYGRQYTMEWFQFTMEQVDALRLVFNGMYDFFNSAEVEECDDDDYDYDEED